MYKIYLIQKGEKEVILNSMNVNYPINLSMIISFIDDESPIKLMVKDKADEVINTIGVRIEKSFMVWEAIEAYYSIPNLSTTEQSNDATIAYISESKWRIRVFLFAIGIITISLIVRGISDIAIGKGLAIFSGTTLLILMVLLLLFTIRVVKRFNNPRQKT
jgi:hypothetical protein